MNPHLIPHALFLAALLFTLGLVGVLVRRNIIFILLSIEIMLNAVALAFIAAGAKWHQAEGQVMYLFILTMAAAEVAVGLALALQIHAQTRTLDVDLLRELKG